MIDDMNNRISSVLMRCQLPVVQNELHVDGRELGLRLQERAAYLGEHACHVGLLSFNRIVRGGKETHPEQLQALVIKSSRLTSFSQKPHSGSPRNPSN